MIALKELKKSRVRPPYAAEVRQQMVALVRAERTPTELLCRDGWPTANAVGHPYVKR